MPIAGAAALKLATFRLSRRTPPAVVGFHFGSQSPHAGAGGARSRAISDRISWNICRGTATSAI